MNIFISQGAEQQDLIFIEVLEVHELDIELQVDEVDVLQKKFLHLFAEIQDGNDGVVAALRAEDQISRVRDVGENQVAGFDAGNVGGEKVVLESGVGGHGKLCQKTKGALLASSQIGQGRR